MIDVRPQPLSAEDTKNLQLWLAKPEGQILRKVVSSMGRAHLAEAMKDALEHAENNAKLDASNTKLAQAQRYQTFIKILDEIANQKKPFTLTTIA